MNVNIWFPPFNDLKRDLKWLRQSIVLYIIFEHPWEQLQIKDFRNQKRINMGLFISRLVKNLKSRSV